MNFPPYTLIPVCTTIRFERIFRPILLFRCVLLFGSREYSLFHDQTVKIFNNCFPKVTSKICYKNRLPWLSSGLKISIKHKHRLHIAYLKNPTPHKKNEYVKFKNKVNHLLKIAERHHYQNEIKLYQNNMRKSWATIKNIINRNKKSKQKSLKLTINGNDCEDPLLIAEAFNKFFTDIGPTLDRKITRTSVNPISFIPKNYEINIFILPTTEEEIHKIIDSLKNCAVGWDELPSNKFKENKHIFAKLLMHLAGCEINIFCFPPAGRRL